MNAGFHGVRCSRHCDFGSSEHFAIATCHSLVFIGSGAVKKYEFDAQTIQVDKCYDRLVPVIEIFIWDDEEGSLFDETIVLKRRAWLAAACREP